MEDSRLNEAIGRVRDIEVLDDADEGYGKFAWILDPNGVKIELWEQVADELP